MKTRINGEKFTTKKRIVVSKKGSWVCDLYIGDVKIKQLCLFHYLDRVGDRNCDVLLVTDVGQICEKRRKLFNNQIARPFRTHNEERRPGKFTTHSAHRMKENQHKNAVVDIIEEFDNMNRGIKCYENTEEL